MATPEELDAMAQTEQAEAAEETEPDYPDLDIGVLATTARHASELLKNNAILFEYLASPELIKTISARERKIMGNQLDRIYAVIEQLDDTLEDAEEA